MRKDKRPSIVGIESKVREILLKEWDPIGVGENPNLKDEYDRYIPQILKVMQGASATVDEIETVLADIESGLGMPVSAQARHGASMSLMRLFGLST